MDTPPEFSIQAACRHWLNIAKTLLACQWKLFETQSQIGLTIVQAAFTSPSLAESTGPGHGPATVGEVEQLERLAFERVSKGLAPPREIYQVPYRNQIDWGKFPEWARPSDPDMFEGSCHEG